MRAGFKPDSCAIPAVDCGPAGTVRRDKERTAVSPGIVRVEGQSSGERISAAKQDTIPGFEIQLVDPVEGLPGLTFSSGRGVVASRTEIVVPGENRGRQ